MTRWIAAILALLMAANGLFVPGQPQAWYDAVPVGTADRRTARIAAIYIMRNPEKLWHLAAG